jgi:hypothetical protein
MTLLFMHVFTYLFVFDFYNLRSKFSEIFFVFYQQNKIAKTSTTDAGHATLYFTNTLFVIFCGNLQISARFLL